MTTEGTPAPDGGTPAGGTPAGNQPWFHSVSADADTMGYLQTRGLDKMDAQAAALASVKAHREAEKFLGVPQDQLLRLPGKDDVKGWDALWGKLGTPTDGKYDFSGIKYGDQPIDADTQVELSKLAHELKLDPARAAKLVTKLAEYGKGAEAKELAASQAERAKEEIALKTNWGPNYNANRVQAEAEIDKMGLSPDLANALKGSAKAMEAFRAVAQQTGEAPFVQGGRGAAGVQTKEQAQYRLNQLNGDPAWYTRYINNDPEAAKEFNDLTAILAAN